MIHYITLRVKPNVTRSILKVLNSSSDDDSFEASKFPCLLHVVSEPSIPRIFDRRVDIKIDEKEDYSL